MKSVFVSRPNWVDGKFEKGLEGFLRVLVSLDLQPRTIGATDYPSKSPLDEVIRLMDLCTGAIILGYPQILVTTGFMKDKPIPPEVVLPTEWNHIEAGLAYARGIPILVIHHRGISRGIFARGAIASFMYEVDMADAALPLRQEIQGAIATWKNDVLTGSEIGQKLSKPGATAVAAAPINPGTTVTAEVKRPTYYCNRCGAIPGGSTKCNPGYTAHDFLPMSGEVFCRRCGVAPGLSTPCNPGYTAHNFLPA